MGLFRKNPGEHVPVSQQKLFDQEETYMETNKMNDPMGMMSQYGVNPQAMAGMYMPAQPQPQQVPVSAAGEIKVEHPTTFEEATKIANLLMNNHTVLLNLEQTNPEIERRLVDFLSGVAFSLRGQLQVVAAHIFCITPHDVSVANGQFPGGRKNGY